MTVPGASTISNDPSRDWATAATALADGEMPSGWALVNSSSYARVAYHADQQVYFKLFLPRSPLESVKAVVRGSRATRARRHNNDLHRAGIEAPRNIAWGQLSRGREYLFSTAVPGMGIDHWLRRELPAGTRDKLHRRRTLMRELGVFIGRLHHSGFIHGDLRSGNVLADWRGGRFRFALIDNERNSRHDMPPGKLLLKNLMQLNMHTPAELGRSDRWRFFAAWRRQMRELSDIEARLIAELDQLVDRRHVLVGEERNADRNRHSGAARRLADKGKLADSPERSSR